MIYQLSIDDCGHKGSAPHAWACMPEMPLHSLLQFSTLHKGIEAAASPPVALQMTIVPKSGEGFGVP